ncbi:hypothetical protein AB3S75_025332 [Citrus x aurantiifolia]
MESDTDAGVNGTHWWWALASTGQLGWGISSFRRGYAGDSRLMPVKAFGVASLFVGSAASASLAFLQASGIRRRLARSGCKYQNATWYSFKNTSQKNG